MELTGFFPVPERAASALERLRAARFDVSEAAIVTGEDAKSRLHKRLAAAKRGRAAAGAAAAGLLSLLLAIALIAPLPEGIPWLAVLAFVGMAALLGAGIGGYYGMGVEKESVLVGLMVSKVRAGEAVRIVQAAGGRFIEVREMPAEGPVLRGATTIAGPRVE